MPRLHHFNSCTFHFYILIFVVMCGASIWLFEVNVKKCSEDLLIKKDSAAELTTPKRRTSPKSDSPEFQPVLEFPRLYEIAPCSPSKNVTVRENVCKNLGAKMAESTRQTYLRLLKFFDEQATARNWTWFMVFGTLLGSWRHHDVIPWDADMDIMVDYKHRMDIVNTIERQERFVPKQCTYTKVRLHDKENVHGSVYIYDLGRWYTPSIDIFFYSHNSTHLYPPIDPTPYKTFKLLDTLPVHKRPLATMMLPAPRNPLKHLWRFYGATDVCKYWEAKCKDFERDLPFAHRKWVNGTMVETLKLNGNVLQVKRVQEIEANLPLNPYTLATRASSKKN